MKAASNGRYLITNEGAPFFVHADTAWRAPQRLSLDDFRFYLDDRVTRGFSAIHLHAVNKEGEGEANVWGERPFAPGRDLSEPNEAYWKHLDALLAAVAERGLLPLVSACWFGAGGAGYRRDLSPETAPVYGRFLAERYAHLRDLIWIQVGDNNPGDRIPAVRALAQTMKAVAPHHLHSAHNAAEYPSSAFFMDDDWLDVDFAYTYRPAYQQLQEENYGCFPRRPILLGETGYEGESNTDWQWTARHVRRQPYWAILSGACGHALGTAGVYHFAADWRERLDWPATRHLAHVKTFFASRDWWRLIPDSRIFALGRGPWGGERVARAARADDDSFALAYVPSPRPITIAGDWAAARWFDPTDGTTRPANLPHPAPPGPNAAGDDDWALILER